MLACRGPQEAQTAFKRYVKDCIMAAQFGSGEVRRLFISQNAERLGRLGGWLLDLPAQEQDTVFTDAIRAREGALPRTLAGLRLAVPRSFLREVRDPLAIWEEAVHAPPTGVAVDPVCGMLVDPGQTPYKIQDGTLDLCFCCPHCLALYGDRLLQEA